MHFRINHFSDMSYDRFYKRFNYENKSKEDIHEVYCIIVDTTPKSEMKGL